MRAQFFSSIAHELRTPLNSIIPILRLVLEALMSSHRNVLDIPRLLKLLKIIQNGATHLENVINDALDIVRLENNKFEILKAPLVIRDIVNDVYDIMKFQIEQKQLSFTYKIADNVPSIIFSDAKRIKQVLFNLVGNAAKFTFTGGISIELAYNQLTRALTGFVKDTGVGIKKEDMALLFRFFGKVTTTKDINRNGMGLGLTISKMILQQLGGTIYVESKEGVGSKFNFTIPLEDQDI
jgi:signal transduction histidine kinase